jgi:hypothetical protein
MAHLTTENIISYLNGRAAGPGKSETEAHLAICAECSESRTQIQALERRLCLEPDYDLPEDFVEGLLNLFPAASKREKPSLGEMIASLIYMTPSMSRCRLASAA